MEKYKLTREYKEKYHLHKVPALYDSAFHLSEMLIFFTIDGRATSHPQHPGMDRILCLCKTTKNDLSFQLANYCVQNFFAIQKLHIRRL